MFEMIKKAIKRVKMNINKKQVKQSLQVKMTTNNDAVNSINVNSNAVVNPNSVRNQLMIRAIRGLPSSVGVCNDAIFDMQRKLNNAAMDIASDRCINEDMKKQIGKNEKEKLLKMRTTH